MLYDQTGTAAIAGLGLVATKATRVGGQDNSITTMTPEEVETESRDKQTCVSTAKILMDQQRELDIGAQDKELKKYAKKGWGIFIHLFFNVQLGGKDYVVTSSISSRLQPLKSPQQRSLSFHQLPH